MKLIKYTSSMSTKFNCGDKYEKNDKRFRCPK